MSASDSLLTGLFDYAGLYPPASLSMLSAANNYLEYHQGKHASALGRFIVNADRIRELQSAVGNSFKQLRLSVVATEKTDWASLEGLILEGAPIETLEIKCGADNVEQVASRIPRGLTAYFEVGLDYAERALETISAAGCRVKIRMGGVVEDAFPPSSEVAQMVGDLARLELPFKATAGLHHPLRSRRPLTYQPQSPLGTMHGFMNLCCAATLLYLGGEMRDAEALLEEQDLAAWRVSSDAIQWNDRSWTAEQIGATRKEFFISVGSCSFEEPIQDLESLGWL